MRLCMHHENWYNDILYLFADLYDAYLAPSLQKTIFVETWQNGPHQEVLPSNCSVKFQVSSVENCRAYPLYY
jgi:hypothetical protein